MQENQPVNKEPVAPLPVVESWIDSTAAKVTGALVAVGATLIATRVAISAAFFKSMNKGPDGAFADLQSTRDAAINAVTHPAKLGREVPDAMDRIKTISNTYDAAYAQRRKLLNIHSVFDEIKALKKHQGREVWFTAGAVATAAIGAILAIGSTRESGRKLDQLEEERQKQQARSI